MSTLTETLIFATNENLEEVSKSIKFGLEDFSGLAYADTLDLLEPLRYLNETEVREQCKASGAKFCKVIVTIEIEDANDPTP